MEPRDTRTNSREVGLLLRQKLHAFAKRPHDLPTEQEQCCKADADNHEEAATLNEQPVCDSCLPGEF